MLYVQYVYPGQQHLGHILTLPVGGSDRYHMFCTLDSCIWATYSEYSVRTLLFCLIGYFLLLTLLEPLEWGYPFNPGLSFMHFYLLNFGVVRLPSSMNIQFQSFGRLRFQQQLIHQIPLRTCQQVSRCMQHYLEQYMCNTLPFIHQHLQHLGFQSTSSTFP